MRLSVLIVNWNTKDFLAKCLESVFASTFDGEFEVVVVDNASSDGSAAMVRERFPNVTLIEPGANTGYAKGNNVAMEAATGDFLLTLNPDTELDPETISRAVDVLQSKPTYGAIGGRLVGLDGETQASVRGFPTMLGIIGDAIGMGRIFKNSVFDGYRLTAFDYDMAQDAEQPMGTFLMFRREALAAIGDPKRPFNERFPIFFNEVDLLDRLRRAGWPCWYEPSVIVKHVGGAGTRQVRKNMIWESHRSLLRYLRQRTAWWKLPVFWIFSGFVILAAFVRAKGYHAGFRP